ncbi:MAG: pirin family protein [Bryobacteraceae bacterium]|nr:pirin family protein [Bryobacteraceae bacterium]MDW8379579.1 pirin family protein [Bryobacterales bacterium]
MIQIIPSAQRHREDFGWLSTRWHFSFDRYYDPQNVSWGPLRVFNDDVVQPGQGFGAHGHRDMEIISYVLEGSLAHADSLGSRHVLKAGEVQVMSAGSGIRHSEYNASETEPVHFLQLWIEPRTKGTQPRWEQRAFGSRAGKLLPVVSSGAIPGTLAIDQDATIYLSELQTGQEVSHQLAPDRKAYLFVIRGSVELNGHPFHQGDQGRIDQEPELHLKATADTELMLLDLPR